jgi:hypothetical protein
MLGDEGGRNLVLEVSDCFQSLIILSAFLMQLKSALVLAISRRIFVAYSFNYDTSSRLTNTLHLSFLYMYAAF